MNREAVKTEVEKVLSTVKQPLIKQYPASKAQITQLEELGLIEFMPTMRKVGIGYTNAAAVIEAATSAKTAVFNRSGEGEEVAASKLYDLLNEKPAESPALKSAKRFNRGQRVMVVGHTAYQHLSHGAVITPMIEHAVDGYETTIRAVYQDEMEDENGNPVIEYTYETADGEQYSAEQLKAI